MHLRRCRGRREPDCSRIRRLELAPRRVVGGVGEWPHQNTGDRGVFGVAFLLSRRRSLSAGADWQGPVQGSQGGGLGGCGVCGVRGGGLDPVGLREFRGDLSIDVQLSVGGFRGKAAAEDDDGDEQRRREGDQHRERGCVSSHVLISILILLTNLMIERRSSRDRLARNGEATEGVLSKKKR